MNDAVPVETPEVPARFTSKYPRNQEVMMRYLEGQSIEEIAAHFELTPTTIRNILKSPLVEKELTRLSQLIAENGVKERIKNLAPEAVDTVRDTMRGAIKNELQFKAANSLLDRHPELSSKQDSQDKFAAGLGESIIRAIGKKLAERMEPEKKEIEVSDEAPRTNNL